MRSMPRPATGWKKSYARADLKADWWCSRNLTLPPATAGSNGPTAVSPATVLPPKRPSPRRSTVTLPHAPALRFIKLILEGLNHEHHRHQCPAAGPGKEQRDAALSRIRAWR